MQTTAVAQLINEALTTHEAVKASGVQISDLKNLADLQKLIAKLIPANGVYTGPDFAEFNAEVILDRSNGLYWHKQVSAKELDETGEKAYIADLNARAVGGFTDWACPSRRQLITLINDEAHEPATFGPFKDSTKTNYWYRTSTALSAYPDLRWFVSFYHGGVSGGHRGYGGFVRAVRVASPGQ